MSNVSNFIPCVALLDNTRGVMIHATREYFPVTFTGPEFVEIAGAKWFRRGIKTVSRLSMVDSTQKPEIKTKTSIPDWVKEVTDGIKIVLDTIIDYTSKDDDSQESTYRQLYELLGTADIVNAVSKLIGEATDREKKLQDENQALSDQVSILDEENCNLRKQLHEQDCERFPVGGNRLPMTIKKSILQDWVLNLPGLRHQGVLLTAVRGCDTSPKEDSSKAITRCMRETMLNCFVGDSSKSVCFIEKVSDDELQLRMKNYLHSLDNYPCHYLMHSIHAAEIIGYFHPDSHTASRWSTFYRNACHKLHLYPERLDQLNARLLKDEAVFGLAQDARFEVG